MTLNLVKFYENVKVQVLMDPVFLTYMFAEEVCVGSELRVNVSDELHNILHRPQVGVLSTGSRAFPRAQKML